MNQYPVYRSRKINANNQLHHQGIKWQVIVNSDMYFMMRQWCMEFFGPTIEYHYFGEHCESLNLNPVWSWDTASDDRWKGHIYLKSDNELDLFEKQFEILAKINK